MGTTETRWCEECRAYQSTCEKCGFQFCGEEDLCVMCQLEENQDNRRLNNES